MSDCDPDGVSPIAAGSDDLRLAPAVGRSREQLTAELEDRRLPVPDADLEEMNRRIQRRRCRRFSLGELLLLTAFVCAPLSLVSYLPAPLLAGALGGFLAASVLLMPRLAARSRIAWPVWWAVGAMYLVAAWSALARA